MEDVSSYTNKLKRSFTLIVPISGTTRTVFSQVKNPDEIRRDRRGREDLDVRKSHKAGLMSSHTLELVGRVGLFLMADASAQGFVSFKRQYHFSENHSYYLDEGFEGLSVAHNFAGGQE